MNEYLKQQPKRSLLPLQFVASKKEKLHKSYDVADPLSEEQYKVTPFLVHRYCDRVLLISSNKCEAYCRHCFRKNILPDLKEPQIPDYQEAVNYVASKKEVREVLFSGGDPLTLTDKKFATLLKMFNLPNRELAIRICTRVPVVAPHKISDELLNIIPKNQKVRFSIQINHSDEITEEFKTAIKKIKSHNIEILSQTVLLKGINDNLKSLKNLYNSLTEIGITPYYLFQGDLALKTKCYRASIKKGYKLYNRLKKALPIEKVPVYAVDLPNGGGKIRIEKPFFKKFEKGYAIFEDKNKILHKYPIE